MPQPPDIIDRVNYVVETWSNPCEAPWYLYMETAQPAALEALVMLACFDVDDIVRYIFRPAGLRGGGHLRSGRKGKRGARRPRLGERIRNKVAPLRAIKNRKVTNGVKTLWVIDGIGQRLLWWWLVADVASGFAYNWTSLLYKTEECQMSASPGNIGAETGPMTVGATPQLEAVNWTKIDYIAGNAGGGPFSFSLGEGKWSIEAAFQLFNFTTNPADTEMRLEVTGPLGTQIVSSGRVVILPGESFSFNVGAKMNGAGGFVVGLWNGNGFLTLTGILFAMAQPPEVAPPLKFKCNSILWPDW